MFKLIFLIKCQIIKLEIETEISIFIKLRKIQFVVFLLKFSTRFCCKMSQYFHTNWRISIASKLTILSEELVETTVTVGLVVLFLKSPLIELFQTEGANEMLWMEFSKHCCYAPTWKRTPIWIIIHFLVIWNFKISKNCIFENKNKQRIETRKWVKKQNLKVIQRSKSKHF